MKSDNYSLRLVKLLTPFLVFFLVSAVVQLLYSVFFSGDLVKAFLTQSPDAVKEAEKSFAESLQKNGLYITGIVNLVCIVLFTIIFKKDEKRIIVPEPRSNPFSYALLALIGAAAGVFLNYALNFLGLVKMLGQDYAGTAETIYSAPLAVQFVVAACMGPIMEELMFRGIIYKRLRTYAIVPLAMLVSSILFGIYHMNLLQFIYAGLLGLLFSYTYEKYHTIVASIIVHACSNGILVFIQNEKGAAMLLGADENRAMITMAVSGIITLAGIIYISRLKNEKKTGGPAITTEV